MSQFAIRYAIAVLDPGAHLYQVTLTIDHPDPAGQCLRLPAWIPGSYKIRDFARHIVTIQARSADQQIPLTKLDKSTWQASACATALELTYEVYAWDLSVRGAHLDDSHAFFNGCCVFLAVVGQEDLPCSLDISKPNWPGSADWRIATAMRELTAARYGFGLYQAEDYAELIDHPVEMGNFTLLTFTAAGIPHDLAISGQHRADTTRLVQDLARICTQQLEFFGPPYPVTRYVFLLMVLGDGYGGLEHRASTALHCSRRELPVLGHDQTMVSEDYHNLLSLCSHEYFHTWNVKRIKPEVFLPYDLRHETHTSLMWIFEGFTRYYEDLHLVRAGIITPEDYLSYLGQLITVMQRNPGQRVQTLADSSFDAWTKLYQADENAPNAMISYYTKGGIVALLLDLKLRQLSRQRHSLDTVMHKLWQRYGREDCGLAEGEIEQILFDLVGQESVDFVQQAVYGLDELPIGDILLTVGILCTLRAATHQKDRGGLQAVSRPERAQLGLRARYSDNGLQVLTVLRGSAAQQAGISAGDLILAIDHLRVTADWEEQLARYPVEAIVPITAFRRDELRQFTAKLQATPLDTCVLTWVEQPSSEQLENRNAWLGSDHRGF